MTEQVLNKIKEKTVRLEWECNSKQMSDQTFSEQQFNFRIATHKKFPKIIFVVYNKDIYRGRVLNKQKLGAYAFNSSDGELLADFNIEKKCPNNFYHELEFGQKIL